MGYRANERGKLSEDFVAAGDGLVAFGAVFILSVQTHYGAVESLRGRRSAQNPATPNGPICLITNAARFAPNRPTPAQSREEILGLTPTTRRLAAARPPQPRESGLASHPNTGPGAEGGGGWPMHATAKPWHVKDGRRRPETCGGCSTEGKAGELHQQQALVGSMDPHEARHGGLLHERASSEQVGQTRDAKGL